MLFVRKPVAIFLLLILLFNIIGYRAWFYYAEKKSDSQLEALLNKNQYDEQDLVVLKVALNMPYQIEQTQFERVDGEVTLDGRIYKYVKRRVSEGNLILLCIPDTHKMSLKKAKTGLDFPASPSPRKVIVDEYEAVLLTAAPFNISLIAPDRGSFAPAGLPEVPVTFPGKPPRLNA
jgi:hypothetical protein